MRKILVSLGVALSMLVCGSARGEVYDKTLLYDFAKTTHGTITFDKGVKFKEAPIEDQALAQEIGNISAALKGQELGNFVNQRLYPRFFAGQTTIPMDSQQFGTTLLGLIKEGYFASANAMLKTGAANVTYNIGDQNFKPGDTDIHMDPIGSMLDAALVVGAGAKQVIYDVLVSHGARRFIYAFVEEGLKDQYGRNQQFINKIKTIFDAVEEICKKLDISKHYPQDYPKRLYFSPDGKSTVEGEDNPEFTKPNVGGPDPELLKQEQLKQEQLKQKKLEQERLEKLEQERLEQEALEKKNREEQEGKALLLRFARSLRDMVS